MQRVYLLKEFVGDGWCDFQNNRGYCGWDNGDCCASTVRGGRVRLMFPTLCTSQLCQCIDPFAIENTHIPYPHNANFTVKFVSRLIYHSYPL